MGEPAQAKANEVRLHNWPTVRVYAEQAEVYPNEWGEERWDSGTWSAVLNLIWQFDLTSPATAIRMRSIGQGLDRSGAVKDAIKIWREGIAPALLSHICGTMIGGAESWPLNNPQTIPGWNTIRGPYVVLGEPSKAPELEAFLQTHALIEPLRWRLATALAKDAPFHTVSLYRAMTPSEVVTSVLIDNRIDKEAGELLKHAYWPEWLTRTPFLSASHFLLCIAPKPAEHRTESGKLLH
jgi:hypothetical protein